MLPGKNISKLIGHAQCLPNQFVDVPVRMAVNPIVSPTGLDEIVLIRNKGSVDTASFEIRG